MAKNYNESTETRFLRSVQHAYRTIVDAVDVHVICNEFAE